MYTVNLHTSGNEIATGADFATLAEAEAAFENPWSVFNRCESRYTAFFVLDGPDAHRERTNPDHKPEPDTDDWAREQAMQNGMAFGSAGYNDTLGY